VNYITHKDVYPRQWEPKFEEENSRKSYLQLVVPKDLREEILEESHAGVMGGHLGENKD